MSAEWYYLKERIGMVVNWLGCDHSSGDIVLMHHRSIKGSTFGEYNASAFLLSPAHGHKDVVRCMYHDVKVSCSPHDLVQI